MNISFWSLERLNRWESFRFLYSVVKFTDSHSEGMPELFISKFETFRAAFEAFDDALVQEHKVNSKELNAAEEGRDLAVRKIYALVREYADYPYNEEKENAAQVLLNVFKPYGTGSFIANMAQDDETSVLINLHQDLMKTIATQSAIETLGLIAVVDSLLSHNTTFVEMQDQRTKEDAHTVLGIVKTTRTEAQQEFISFVEVVNALAIVEGEEKYASLKLEIGKLHKNIVAKAKQRHNRNSGEEETNIEVVDIEVEE